MTKFLITSFLYLLCIISLSFGKVNLGFKLGINLSNYKVIGPKTFINEGYKFDNTFGYDCSFFIDYPFNNIFGIILESGYSQVGFDERTKVLLQDDFKDRNNYLEYFNLQLKLKVKYSSKSYELYTFTGFGYSYLLNENIESYFPTGLKIPFYDFNTSNYSIHFGVGFEFLIISKYPTLIELDYKHDLNNVYKYSDFEMKSKYIIQFLLGIKLFNL